MLTSIANRLTPSLPMEITFGAQPLPTGTAVAVLVGHRADAGGSLGVGLLGLHEVVNVGDADAAQKEVDAIAGDGSQIGQMAAAFVAVNSEVSTGARANFPRFKVLILPKASAGVTDANLIEAAKSALKLTRIDWLVSSWDGFATETRALETFGVSISGPDNDMRGQFGTLSISATLSTVEVGLASTKDTAYSSTLIFPDSSTEKAQTVHEMAAAYAGLLAQNQFPYLPLDGAEFGGRVKPAKAADIIVPDPLGASEALLRKGMAPATVDVNGNVRLIRARNNRVSFMGDGVVPATSYLDVQDIQPLFDFREDMFNELQTEPYKNKKATVRQAGSVLDASLAMAALYEKEGAFQNVKAAAPKFKAEVSSSSRGRIDFFVPADVSPGNHVTAGNIQAQVFTI